MTRSNTLTDRRTIPEPKKKLTPEQKREKKRRKEQFETIFVGGKQKRVRRREPLIEGLPVDEFIRNNADPIWLHQNEMWEYIEPKPTEKYLEKSDTAIKRVDDDDDLPF